MSSQWKYYLYLLFIICKNKCNSYKVIVLSVFGWKEILPDVLESDIQSSPLIDTSTVKRIYFLCPKTMPSLQ